MSTLTIIKPRTHAEASDLLKSDDYRLPVLKAGGMDIVDHMKEGLLDPDALINIRGLRSEEGPNIHFEGRLIRVDADATLADLADSSLIRENAPALGRAALSAATPQVRNVATVAGNLLQRPRCWYYRNEQFDCLKKGGATCYAVAGENKYHAIFGDGPCHIVHPSNVAPALMTMDATVHVVGGDRSEIPIADLFHGPDRGVRTEHTLERAEVITHITFASAHRSGFAVVKEKQSFDWPLAFAIANLETRGREITSARICAGAVAPVPWPLPNVAQRLTGVDMGDETAIARACEVAAEGANPMTDNAYKARLLPVVVKRAVLDAIAQGGAQ